MLTRMNCQHIKESNENKTETNTIGLLDLLFTPWLGILNFVCVRLEGKAGETICP